MHDALMLYPASRVDVCNPCGTQLYDKIQLKAQSEAERAEVDIENPGRYPPGCRPGSFAEARLYMPDFRSVVRALQEKN